MPYAINRDLRGACTNLQWYLFPQKKKKKIKLLNEKQNFKNNLLLNTFYLFVKQII